MCMEGGCGACIVTVEKHHPVSGEKTVSAINSVSWSAALQTIVFKLHE